MNFYFRKKNKTKKKKHLVIGGVAVHRPKNLVATGLIESLALDSHWEVHLYRIFQ